MPADGPPWDAVQDTDTDQHNIVSVISRFADEHLTVVRSISTGLALAGVVLIARSIKLTSRFGAASEVPAHFIRSNVSLRGRVRTISDGGLLEVEHVPIVLPTVTSPFSKRVSSSSLAVRLAGVEPTPEGEVWLQRHLAPAQMVWLKLISREDDILHCLVSHSKGAFWSLCVNEELLRLGLGRTIPVCGVAPDSRLYWRLHGRLLRAESKAEKKGRGLWRQPGFWERARDSVRCNRLFSAVRRLFGRP